MVIVLIILCVVLTRKSEPSQEVINVYSWGEFISDGNEGSINVNKEFTRRTGIKVNYKTFQSNEELFAKLSGGATDYDVIIPSEYMVSKLIENNMLEKLDFSNIPNFKFIDDRFKNLNFDTNNEYSVPYMWGMVGIFYNKREVEESEENITWDILWDKKYRNKILMFDNARDSFAIALLKLGYSVNTQNENEWKEAAKELLIQKPLVQAYVMDQIFNKMQNHEAYLAPYYSGDASTIIKNNPEIGFVIPKSGSVRFVDSLCIPKGSAHKEQAEKYINFMCETDIALSNVKHIGYSTPHKEAYNLLEESTRKNEISYPENSTLEKSQVFINLPNSVNALIDKLWVEVKAGGISTQEWQLPLILIGFLVVYIVALMLKKRVNFKKI